jgi:hypothetical protein
MQNCEFILQNGRRCGKRSIIYKHNIWCCREHNTNEYLIYNFSALEESNYCLNEEKYLNFKLKNVLKNEDLSLVMMNQDIKISNISKFIYETIEYLKTRPDIYDMLKTEYELEKITYNLEYAIYYIYVKH